MLGEKVEQTPREKKSSIRNEYIDWLSIGSKAFYYLLFVYAISQTVTKDTPGQLKQNFKDWLKGSDPAYALAYYGDTALEQGDYWQAAQNIGLAVFCRASHEVSHCEKVVAEYEAKIQAAIREAAKDSHSDITKEVYESTDGDVLRNFTVPSDDMEYWSNLGVSVVDQTLFSVTEVNVLAPERKVAIVDSATLATILSDTSQRPIFVFRLDSEVNSQGGPINSAKKNNYEGPEFAYASQNSQFMWVATAADGRPFVARGGDLRLQEAQAANVILWSLDLTADNFFMGADKEFLTAARSQLYQSISTDTAALRTPNSWLFAVAQGENGAFYSLRVPYSVLFVPELYELWRNELLNLGIQNVAFTDTDYVAHNFDPSDYQLSFDPDRWHTETGADNMLEQVRQQAAARNMEEGTYLVITESNGLPLTFNSRLREPVTLENVERKFEVYTIDFSDEALGIPFNGDLQSLEKHDDWVEAMGVAMELDFSSVQDELYFLPKQHITAQEDPFEEVSLRYEVVAKNEQSVEGVQHIILGEISLKELPADEARDSVPPYVINLEMATTGYRISFDGYLRVTLTPSSTLYNQRFNGDGENTETQTASPFQQLFAAIEASVGELPQTIKQERTSGLEREITSSAIADQFKMHKQNFNNLNWETAQNFFGQDVNQIIAATDEPPSFFSNISISEFRSTLEQGGVVKFAIAKEVDVDTFVLLGRVEIVGSPKDGFMLTIFSGDDWSSPQVTRVQSRGNGFWDMVQSLDGLSPDFNFYRWFFDIFVGEEH